MDKLTVAYVLSKALKVRSKEVVPNFTCLEYEDREVYVAVLNEKMSVPRMCGKYIDEDVLVVLHPLLYCTTTYTKPLLIYAKVNADINVLKPTLIGRITFRKPSPERTFRRLLGKLVKLSPNLATAVGLLTDEEKPYKIVVDGRDADLTSLITCPKMYGLYVGGDEVIFVGNRKRV